ncbi:hypothetical protein [Ferruginibacter sp.]|nr:hypothetical protein [Ferruginibacter sp.]
MKKNYLSLFPVLFSIVLSLSFTSCNQNTQREENEEYDNPDKAAAWQFKRTKDPATGKVPQDIMWQSVLHTQALKNQFINAPNSSTALNWTERGSYTDAPGPFGNSRPPGSVTSGRIDAILVDKADPTGKTVFIGGDMGGLWKTTDITTNPATWTLINDFMGNLIISAITQDPTNNDIMYFSTGEAYYGGELGIGVFKSIDHGVTWNLLPSTAAVTRSSKILCDFQGNVYLASNGITGGGGLLRSTNGGTNWTDITPTGLSNRICDLEITSTTGPGRLHVVTGISSAMGYRFTDNPATVTSGTWTTPTTNFTTAALKRAEIAVSGNTLFALPVDANNEVPTIYKSVDGGDNWAPTAGQPTAGWATGQGWYALAAAINPSDANQCVIGGLDNYKTTNGGASWTKISVWVGNSGNYVHADQHTSIWYDNGNKFLFGSDGGIFYSADGGITAVNRNVGLRLKEFYSCAIHPTLTNYFLAGAQDNGTHQFNGAGLTSSIEITGGDGAYVDIDQDQPQYQFGAYIYNQYRRSTNGGTSWSSINFSSSAGEFINPFDYDDLGNRMYCCYSAGQYLRWENPQIGNTTTTVSMPLFNGGLAEAISVSPYTANRVYFGTSNGRVIKVDNAEATTPTAVNITGAGMPGGGFVNSISVGSSDQNLVACFSNYGVTNVWVSADGGTTWTGQDGTLPNIPVYWAVFHPDDNNKMIIATETGVWETDALNGAATVWIPSPNFPTVRTSMLKYRSSDRTLLASTYGRGLWTTTIAAGCTSAGIATQPANTAACVAANATFTLAASGTGYQWEESTNGGGTWANITNGGIYGGALTTTLTLTGVTALMNTYQYRCVVTGNCAPLTATSTSAILTVNALTNISSQPTPVTICANANTSFSVAATGTALTYQWQVSTNGGVSFSNLSNGAPYSTVTTNTLNITAATTTLNTYQYRCVISGLCTPVNSTATVLTVNAAPTVTTQPANTSICAGNNVSFSVGAVGAGLTYQWQLSTDGGVTFNNIGGATAVTYSFVALLAQNNNQYRCVVSGTCTPAATSAAAILSVGTTLIINSQPAAAIVCAGANTAYSVNVSGTVTYQWQVSTDGGITYTNITNGGIYSNATTATLTLTGVPATANNNLYRCAVSGSCPTINSNSAILTVNTSPSFTTQPAASSTICAAQNTSFTVAAVGTAVTYQWQVSTNGGVTFANLTNGGVYNNVTTTTLSITGATAAMNTYKYRCIANGTCAPYDSSSIATLTVHTPVAVSTNPTGTTVCENSNASFTVVASGTTPSYQWQVSTDGGATYNNVANSGVYSGATTPTLNLAGVNFGLNNTLYRCVINGTALCGATVSGIASLVVNPAPPAATVTGGGTYCVGSNGVAVGLSNSATGINYQLQLAGVNTGTPLAGTGGALNFGNKTTAGIYTVIATNTATGCTKQMTGNVSVVINPLPTIALNAAPYKNLYPGLQTTITATATTTATPNTITYFWFKNNTPIANTSNTIAVNISSLGDYRVTVIDANGCINQSQVVTIADSANSNLFIFPSPNDGLFNIAYYNQGGASLKRTVAIFSNKGEKVYNKDFQITQAYQLLNIDMRKHGAGIYYVVLSDANSIKLKTGKVLVR